MKKILLSIILLLAFSSLIDISLASNTIRDWMVDSANDISSAIDVENNGNGTDDTIGIIKYFMDFIFWVSVVLFTWVFIFIWWKLIISRWNEEEFKKAMMWFLYAIWWAALLPASYAIIKIITWLDL